LLLLQLLVALLQQTPLPVLHEACWLLLLLLLLMLLQWTSQQRVC
jgi:hypothetical protein